MHDIHQQIIQINDKQSTAYVADEAARRRHWAKHSTYFACVKCMDGRVHFPNMTETPVGIVKAFRAIGGKFEAWWPSFLGRMRRWIEDAMTHGSHSCVFVTYHFSASDPHLGCAGWHYDTKAARAHAEKLRDDLSFVFGEQLTAITAGIETDCDVLTLHGPNGDVSGADLKGLTPVQIETELRAAFPNMPADVVRDLVPFMLGNADHVASFDHNPRPHEEKEHNERIVALGQGFDWIATSNMALIINDADPNLDESVRVAASLIAKNLAKSPNEDATLLTNVPFSAPGADYRQAVARTKGLLEFAKKIVSEAYPDLFASGRVHALATVTFEPSRKAEVIVVE